MISKHFTVKPLFKRSGLSPAEFKEIASHCIFAVTLTHIKLVINWLFITASFALKPSTRLRHSSFSFLNFELKNQKWIQKLLSKSAQAQTYSSSGRAVILLPQPPGLDYPKTVRFPTPNYDKLPSILLVRIRCSHVANVTYPALAHCFLIPATKTFSLTPVPLKLLPCFSSFFSKG